ncbi:MAG: type II secretion system protein [Gammaproteobacteria bacterium]|nr:type II secretion system protein [Gammaproteobacteria bacterium]
MKSSRTDPSARQSGFSLLELAVTLALFSILAGTLQLSMTRRLVDDIERDRTEQAAGEIYRLANAAQHYAIDENKWPLEILLCQGAYEELDAKNLLKGAPKHSPYLNSGGNQTEYALSCDSSHFTVTVTTESAGQATSLKQKIPGSSVSGIALTVHYPKPADAGGGGSGGEFMPLDGSASPTATWNLGNQYLFGARDVATETGQTLLNSVQFATVANPGDLIRKPTCPGSMTPRIFTALNRVSALSGRALHGIQLPVDELADSWRVRAVITGSGGDESATPDTATITVFVKCSY